jgi:hypothetical protein
MAVRSATASWLVGLLVVAGLIGLVLLIYVVQGTPSSAPGASSPTPPGPRSRIPPELAALGDDPDGDGVSTEEELRRGTDPLVADYPQLQFSFSEPEYGLRRETKGETVQGELIVRSTDMMEEGRTRVAISEERTRREQDQEVVFSGSGGLEAGAVALPISYSGLHTQHTVEDSWRYQSSYSVSAERVKRVAQQYQEFQQEQTKVVIRPDAGYFKCKLSVSSSHTCRLEDFAVNIKVNGRLLWTRRASNDPQFRPLTITKGGRGSDSILFTFQGFNREEMSEHLLKKGRVTVTFEVPQSTVQLGGEFADPEHFRKTLDSIQSRCALVEVSQGGKSSFAYVSTAAAADRNELPLDQLLRRVPGAGAVQWGEGPAGPYLINFANRHGVGLIRPGKKDDGMWLVFHQGDQLDSAPSGKVVHAGEYVKVQYLTPREYWGDVDEWRGYPGAYQALRDLRQTERRFWTEVEDCNTGGKTSWDALFRQNLIQEAREIHKQYVSFFHDHGARPIIAHYYPHAEEAARQFAAWFNGEDVHLPTYGVRVNGARVWWNVDKRLDPVVIIRCNGKEIKSREFKRDEGKMSGQIAFAPEDRFSWSPFDLVELEVLDAGLVDQSLRHVRFSDFSAAAGLLEEQPLDRLRGADAALSRVQLMCAFTYEETAVEANRYREHLEGLKPRVIGFVPDCLCEK